jgi:hypothetical protein
MIVGGGVSAGVAVPLRIAELAVAPALRLEVTPCKRTCVTGAVQVWVLSPLEPEAPVAAAAATTPLGIVPRPPPLPEQATNKTSAQTATASRIKHPNKGSSMLQGGGGDANVQPLRLWSRCATDAVERRRRLRGRPSFPLPRRARAATGGVVSKSDSQECIVIARCPATQDTFGSRPRSPCSEAAACTSVVQTTGEAP